MNNIHDNGIVTLSLFATGGVSPKEPHRESEIAEQSGQLSSSAEAALFHGAAAEGVDPGIGVIKGSEVRIHGPRESNCFHGGKGVVPPDPWESSNIESVGFKSIGSLLKGSVLNQEEKKSPRRVFKSQRGELLTWFYGHLSPHWGGKKPIDERYIGYRASCAKVTTRDLFYMKSVFIDTAKRKGEDAACREFWGSLKPREDVH